jgi:hypothetical protein
MLILFHYITYILREAGLGFRVGLWWSWTLWCEYIMFSFLFTPVYYMLLYNLITWCHNCTWVGISHLWHYLLCLYVIIILSYSLDVISAQLNIWLHVYVLVLWLFLYYDYYSYCLGSKSVKWMFFSNFINSICFLHNLIVFIHVYFIIHT